MGPRWTTALALGAVMAFGCRRSEPQPASHSSRPSPLANASAPRTPLDCPARLHIDLTYPGASPSEIELSVVMAVEAAVGDLEGLERIDATITEGHASVWASVPSSELEPARRSAQELLGRITTFPADVEEPIVSIVSAPGPAMVVVTSRGPADMVSPTVDHLGDALKASTDTTSVHRHGQITPGPVITIEPSRLAARGIGHAELVEAVQRALVSRDDSMLVRARPTTSIEQLQETIVSSRDGAPVRLRDVANLRVDSQPEGPRAWIGDSSAQVLVVESENPEAVQRIVAESAENTPDEVGSVVAGELWPRSCGAPSAGPELGGDLELLQFEFLALARDRAHAEHLLTGAPAAVDALWLTADSILGDCCATPGSARASAELLVAKDSPKRDELVQWIAHRPELRVRGHYGPVRGHTVIELQFPDPEQLPNVASSLLDSAQNEGLHATARAHDSSPRITVEVSPERAARIGVSAHEISKHVRFALYAQPLGSIYDGDRIVPVRIDPSATADELSLLSISTASGPVRLRDVAELRLEAQPDRLTRRDRRRVADVIVWFAAEDRKTVLDSIDQRLLPTFLAAHPGLQVRRDP